MSQPVKPNARVEARGVAFANDAPFSLIAGPCALESRAHALEMAGALKEIAGRLGVGLVFKTSYDKANRTSLTSARGIGLEDALPIFAEIRESLGLAVLTDVHAPEQCERAAEAVDILQIPAFLCRQTDLLVAAARTGRVVNIKKGQFLAPWDMQHVAGKVLGAGNANIMLTERGVSFGYNTLVSDMRALPIMAQTGCPVIFDATHSVQQPGGQGGAARPVRGADCWVVGNRPDGEGAPRGVMSAILAARVVIASIAKQSSRMARAAGLLRSFGPPQ